MVDRKQAIKGVSEPIQSICKLFNERVDDGKNMEEYSTLLSSAIQSMIEVIEEKDIDSLFKSDRTSALTQIMAGLDDFELIAFLVIQEHSA